LVRKGPRKKEFDGQEKEEKNEDVLVANKT
jgi:hypothetical protein